MEQQDEQTLVNMCEKYETPIYRSACGSCTMYMRMMPKTKCPYLKIDFDYWKWDCKYNEMKKLEKEQRITNQSFDDSQYGE